MPASKTIKDETMQAQILQQAQRLSQQYGFHKMTMDDVAQAMGMGRSSLYYYYKSIDEIKEAVKNAAISEILAEIAQAVDKAATVEEKIRAFCKAKLTVMRKKIALYQMSSGNEPKTASQLQSKEERQRNYLKKEAVILHQVIALGIAQGKFRALTKKEQEVLVFVLLNGMHGLQKEIIQGGDYQLEPVVQALSKMILQGLKA